MIQICQKDKKNIYEEVHIGQIDAAEMSFPNLLNDILLTIKKHRFTEFLSQDLQDKCKDNCHIPFDIPLCLDINTKLNPLTATEVEPLVELEWNLWDNEYDGISSVIKIDGETMWGYKLGVLRGVLNDFGIAKEVVLNTLKNHKMKTCKELLKSMSCFYENNIRINDRGFLSQNTDNYLKTKRKVDIYFPTKENMVLYQDIVKFGIASGKCQKQLNQKRKCQEIQLVTGLGLLWERNQPQEDVSVNPCIVYGKKTDNYVVFMTTDSDKPARQIINTYELRPETEEAFRRLEDFKSTKYNYVIYYIVMTLMGYFYFQIYKNMDESKAYIGKSLPVVVKNYKETRLKAVIIYVRQYFGILFFLQFLQFYAECTLEARRFLNPILAKV